jgi:hypothetical protein
MDSQEEIFLFLCSGEFNALVPDRLISIFTLVKNIYILKKHWLEITPIPELKQNWSLRNCIPDECWPLWEFVPVINSY